jgi:hypothetical protein
LPVRTRARQLAVQLGAGQLLQQFGPLIRTGIEKSGKTTLCQQHGFGKAGKIQPGDGGNPLELFVAVGGDDGAIASASSTRAACKAPSALSRARRWLQNAR